MRPRHGTPDGIGVIADLAARLADYKVPDVIRLTAEPLPRNNNGKLMKAALRAQAEDEARQAAPAARPR